MPSAAARRMYEDQIPSFMSVFDLDPDTMADRDVVTVVDPKLMEVDPTCANPAQQQRLRPNPLSTDSSHHHNDSTSTQNTESADSSPTTTLSTTDSASLSDPSPSSSPDSPVNLMPISSFSAAPFSHLNTSDAAMAPLASLAPPPLPPPETSTTTPLARPMTSPSPRRPRNMKGLSIQPVSLNNTMTSEPSSPSSSFIKPKVPPMKRKPSQLSLKTNSSDLNLRQQPTLLEMPKSPGPVAPILQRRALKHSTSSPHMLSGLKSAGLGPVGGMAFPTVFERNESGLSNFLRPSKSKPGLDSFDDTIVEEDSPIKAQIASRATIEFEPFREQENEDQKTPGYPDGPICIYDPNIYLYLEPTAEEAAKFDTVINVAREVRNPFKNPFPLPKKQQDDDIPVPETAITGPSFAAGFEARMQEQARESQQDSPTTPKPAITEPEYIHIPWDHNTDIQTDLMNLCETVENRTNEGKKVLIHCQQGASRSASLIIAYGMYKNPELSVNDAYYAAQSRSKWISPNMRLMYCLQDFQKEVAKKKLPPGSALKSRSGRSPTKHHRLTLSADNIDVGPKEPLSAPLPNEADLANVDTPQVESPAVRSRGQSSTRGEPLSPGPSSAPSTFSWTEKEDDQDPGRFGRFNIPTLMPPPENTNTFDHVKENFAKPLPSPGFPPPLKALDLPPPPPKSTFGALPPRQFSLAPASKSADGALAPIQLSLPPASPGFPPPRALDFPPAPTSTSGGFAPLQLNLPPSSPGFGSFGDMMNAKPPPSPGFGAHRFGKPGGVSFGSLNFGVTKEEPKAEAVSHLKPERTEPAPAPLTTLEKPKVAIEKPRLRPKLSFQEPPATLENPRLKPKLSFHEPLAPAGSLDLPLRGRPLAITREEPDDALMSPRVETMTNNPLHDNGGAGFAGMQFMEVPGTPSEGLFSPRQTMFPRDPFCPFARPTQVADPRSPPTKGETPIVRSIDEMI